MSEHTQPREWLISGPTWAQGAHWTGAPLNTNEEVRSIEREPVLDLLEGWWRTLDDAASLPNERCYTTWRELGDFLRTHGRLG